MCSRLFLIVSSFHAISIVKSEISYSPVIETKSGPVRGRLVTLADGSSEVYEFLGIPFAEPPVDDLRFQKTVPLKERWNKTLTARKWPSCCMQTIGLSRDPRALKYYLNVYFSNFLPKESESEDCLYLNLWVPRSAIDRSENSSSLATYTFIHGGGFTQGGAAAEFYNGSILASRNNIIVTSIQYRLGALGFAYLGNDSMPGNMGLWDQLEALRWLCENLPAFGGNCSRHTIGGESAGASSVAFLVLKNHPERYFSQAILESGSALADWSFRSAEDGRQITEALMANLNCSDIACLMKADSNEFGPISGGLFGFGPIIDGEFLAGNPLDLLKAGNFTKIPTLAGANGDEAGMFLVGTPVILDLDLDNPEHVDALNLSDYQSLLEEAFLNQLNLTDSDSALFQAILTHYWPKEPAKGKTFLEAAGQALADYILACPTYDWAEIAGPANQTWVYQFTHRSSGTPWPKWIGVTHTDELLYVFGFPFTTAGADLAFGQEEKLLSQTVMAYFGNFVKNGNPNVRDPESHGGTNSTTANHDVRLRDWPSFQSEGCSHNIVDLSAVSQVFNYGPASNCNLKARDCKFWSDVVLKMLGGRQPPKPALNSRK